MLTREECLEAYEVIDTLIHLMCGETREDGYEPTMDEMVDSMKKIEQLINEHFELKEKYSKILDDVHDYRYEIQFMKVTIRNLCKHFGVNNQEELKNIYLNKPIKFEELKEGMWVWDNKTKSYIFIFKPLNWEPIKGIRYANMIINHSADGYYMDFEENRLFRYEVKNDHNRKSH